MSQLMDSALSFQGGFRLPGSVRVQDKSLDNVYKKMPDVFQVPALFPARFGERADAEFRVMFSQQVYAQQSLIVECLGDYRLQAADFEVLGLGQGQVPAVTQVDN